MCKATTFIMAVLAAATACIYAQTAKWELTNIRPLTDTTISVHYYVWSPDGQKIAMTCQGFDNRLFVLELKPGAKPVCLADNLGATGIQWSPDSKNIVYVTKNPDEEKMKTARDVSEGYRWSAMVVDVASNKTEEIAYNDFGFGNPKWHSDGEIVIIKSGKEQESFNVTKWKGKAAKKGRDFVSYKRNGDILLSIKNNIEHKFVGPFGGTFISNNGKYIATNGKGGLIILQLDPPYGEKRYGTLLTPLDWSSDDSNILCADYPLGEEIKGVRGNICIFTIKDGSIHNLLDKHFSGDENMAYLDWPKYSPDGKQISFVASMYRGKNILYVGTLKGE